jgi:hypothetical protein
MSAQAEILTTKHDVLKQKGSVPNSKLVDLLFENFLQYASANWSYSAQSGKQTATDLLSGSGPKNVACGTLREGFKLLIRNELKLQADNEDINNYFISKPTLKCFDNKVSGNIGNPSSGVFNLGCHFSTHYFVKSEGKYYDPCLSSIYSSATEPILINTSLITGFPGGSLRFGGTGKAIVILRLIPGRSVPGFGSTWELFSLFKDNIAKKLTSKEYAAVKLNPVIKAAGVL